MSHDQYNNPGSNQPQRAPQQAGGHDFLNLEQEMANLRRGSSAGDVAPASQKPVSEQNWLLDGDEPLAPPEPPPVTPAPVAESENADSPAVEALPDLSGEHGESTPSWLLDGERRDDGEELVEVGAHDDGAQPVMLEATYYDPEPASGNFSRMAVRGLVIMLLGASGVAAWQVYRQSGAIGDDGQSQAIVLERSIHHGVQLARPDGSDSRPTAKGSMGTATPVRQSNDRDVGVTRPAEPGELTAWQNDELGPDDTVTEPFELDDSEPAAAIGGVDSASLAHNGESEPVVVEPVTEPLPIEELVIGDPVATAEVGSDAQAADADDGRESSSDFFVGEMAEADDYFGSIPPAEWAMGPVAVGSWALKHHLRTHADGARAQPEMGEGLALPGGVFRPHVDPLPMPDDLARTGDETVASVSEWVELERVEGRIEIVVSGGTETQDVVVADESEPVEVAVEDALEEPAPVQVAEATPEPVAEPVAEPVEPDEVRIEEPLEQPLEVLVAEPTPDPFEGVVEPVLEPLEDVVEEPTEVRVAEPTSESVEVAVSEPTIEPVEESPETVAVVEREPDALDRALEGEELLPFLWTDEPVAVAESEPGDVPSDATPPAVVETSELPTIEVLDEPSTGDEVALDDEINEPFPWEDDSPVGDDVTEELPDLVAHDDTEPVVEDVESLEVPLPVETVGPEPLAVTQEPTVDETTEDSVEEPVAVTDVSRFGPTRTDSPELDWLALAGGGEEGSGLQDRRPTTEKRTPATGAGPATDWLTLAGEAEPQNDTTVRLDENGDWYIGDGDPVQHGGLGPELTALVGDDGQDPGVVAMGPEPTAVTSTDPGATATGTEIEDQRPASNLLGGDRSLFAQYSDFLETGVVSGTEAGTTTDETPVLGGDPVAHVTDPMPIPTGGDPLANSGGTTSGDPSGSTSGTTGDPSTGMGEVIDEEDEDSERRGGLRRIDERKRWTGTTPPVDHITGSKRLLTPNVGDVRVVFHDGEIFEGKLHAVGMGIVWLETSLGRMSLDGRRVKSVENLGTHGVVADADPNDKDYSRLPRVRVRTKGGVFVGYQLARKGDEVTLMTDEGYRITLKSDDVEAANGRRTTVEIKKRD